MAFTLCDVPRLDIADYSASRKAQFIQSVLLLLPCVWNIQSRKQNIVSIRNNSDYKKDGGWSCDGMWPTDCLWFLYGSDTKLNETAGHITRPVSVGRADCREFPDGSVGFWCERVVVVEWWDINSDSLSLPVFSHPFFSSSLPLLFIPPLHVPDLSVLIFHPSHTHNVSPFLVLCLTLFFCLPLFCVCTRIVRDCCTFLTPSKRGN